jgi:hypothetical protein
MKKKVLVSLVFARICINVNCAIITATLRQNPDFTLMIFLLPVEFQKSRRRLLIFPRAVVMIMCRGGSRVFDERFTRFTQLIGGSGGMPPRKKIKIWGSETAFPAFWRHF